MGKHTAVGGGRPLVVTSDEALLDELLQFAASAGVEVDVAADASTASRSWTDASLVVIDDSVVSALMTQDVTRRGQVIVIGRDLDDAGVWRRAVNVGADHVVFLPDAADWLAEQFQLSTARSAQARVVTVLTASGGCGASTLAATVAMRATTRKLAPVLIDADPLGGGLDLLLGAETEPGVRWPDLADTDGRIGGQTLIDALPKDHGLPFLSWTQAGDDDAIAATYGSVLSALTREDSLVVVDLGRHTGPLSRAVLSVTTTAVLLVPARVRAVAAASTLLKRLDHLRDELCLVVRRPSPAGLDESTIARVLDLPLIGTLPHDGRRAEWEENGLPPSTKGGWARVSDAVLDDDRSGSCAA